MTRRTKAMREYDRYEAESGYRLADRGSYDGCWRCQDGDHWSCHGCSCPCSHENPFESAESKAERQAGMDRVAAPRIPWVAAPSDIVAETRTLDRLQRMAAGYFG